MGGRSSTTPNLLSAGFLSAALVAEKPVWQSDFFDRQLRSGESYTQKWLYLWENPIKEGLVKTPEDWPYQGELNVLPWHAVP